MVVATDLDKKKEGFVGLDESDRQMFRELHQFIVQSWMCDNQTCLIGLSDKTPRKNHVGEEFPGKHGNYISLNLEKTKQNID